MPAVPGGARRTIVPGVYVLTDGSYFVRVTWSPTAATGKKRFFEAVRYCNDRDEAIRARDELAAELRSRLAPTELLDADGVILGRIFDGKVHRDIKPAKALPLPPPALFEAEE